MRIDVTGVALCFRSKLRFARAMKDVELCSKDRVRVVLLEGRLGLFITSTIEGHRSYCEPEKSIECVRVCVCDVSIFKVLMRSHIHGFLFSLH